MLQQNNGNERKLATIRRVSDVKSIDGADKICAYCVDGWWVVDQIDKFIVGDLAVYFEIDSVLPIRDEFEFLRKGCYVKKDWLVTDQNQTGEGFRLKTIRLRGQISQGLLLPIDAFLFLKYPEEGDCVDGPTGVVKWDPPLPATLSGKARGNFPSFIPKTDQERIQNISRRDLDKYAEDNFEVTLKLDGSSMTVFNHEDRVGLCSRNLELDYVNSSDTTFARVLVESGLLKAMSEELFVENLAIQGELMGPGIQGNRENLREHTFYVYDVYNIKTGSYLTSDARLGLVHYLQSSLGVKIDHCPRVGGVFKAAMFSVAELLEMAEGPSINNPTREGLVFKSIQNPNFSFKAISNKYLMKGGE